MDKLTSMRAFTKVVAHQSFSGAAREMRLSRSAISKYIADLEQELGVQLLRRTTRSATPTDNGRVYCDRCLAVIAAIEEAELAVTQSQANPRGQLRINAPMSFGTLYLGKAIAEFMGRYPELQIQLVLSDQQIDTVQEGFDLTIRIADVAAQGLATRNIAPVRRVLCASPDYLQRRGSPRHPSDLRDHDCLSYGYLGTGVQWKLTGSDGDHWLRVPWMLCTNNAEVLRDAAVGGRGIATLPAFIATAQLASGELREVLPAYRAPELALCALFPPTRHLDTKVRVFIDFLVERFGDGSSWASAGNGVAERPRKRGAAARPQPAGRA